MSEEVRESVSRREAIGKMGRFAAYTAPTMMVLLTSEKAMARSNEQDPGKAGGHDPGKAGGHDPGKAGGHDPGKPKSGG